MRFNYSKRNKIYTNKKEVIPKLLPKVGIDDRYILFILNLSSFDKISTKTAFFFFLFIKINCKKINVK